MDINSLISLPRPKKGKNVCQLSGIRPTLAEVVDLLPELNIHGFRCFGRNAISEAEHRKLRDKLCDPESLGGLSRAAMKQLAGWLSSFNPSRTWAKSYRTYGLKHTFERETGTYLMDGAFITGVLMAGFEIKIDGPTALIKARRPAL